MDIHTLQYFKKAAELQHITKAAEELHIVQPSLSRTISQLEQELGVKLFERVGKNISLNRFGEIVLRHTNRILQELKDIENEIKDATNESSHSVTLSIYAASKLIPSLITAFKKEYPAIRLQIFQQGMVKGLQGEPDLSLFASTQLHDSFSSMTLVKEEILLAVPKWHPLSNKFSVNLQEMADSEFICLQSGKSLRSLTDAYCQLAGFEPKIILETDSPETIRELIAAGVGIAFIPSITWSGIESSSIALLHIAFPTCQRYINLSWRTSGYISPAAILLRGFIQDYFRQLT